MGTERLALGLALTLALLPLASAEGACASVGCAHADGSGADVGVALPEELLAAEAHANATAVGSYGFAGTSDESPHEVVVVWSADASAPQA